MAPLTFAHRGGVDGGHPDNSLAAFGDARARGCDLETDLRLSADGEVMCVHDAVGLRLGRPTWPRHMSAARLARRQVPTLAALYATLGCDFELSCDLKVPEVAGPAMAVARTAGILRRLWLVSDDRSLLAAIRREEPAVRLVHESRHADLAAEGISHGDHLSRLAAAGIDAANTTAGDWTPALVSRAHALGLAAFGSLLQSRAAMERAVALGLDGFYSDHCDAMRAVVAACP